MNRALLFSLALCTSSCHLARVEPPEPACYDNAVVSCHACTNRACVWCSEGPNPSDGYCCESSKRCEHPITTQQACEPIAPCDEAIVSSCDECKNRGCAWCPGEDRCHGRGDDGTFPSCEGRIAGAAQCPAAATAKDTCQ